MDVLKRLFEKDIEVVIDNLFDYYREIDRNVVIVREFIFFLLGFKGVIVFNFRYVLLSELYVKEFLKLRVVFVVGIWRGFGIG